MMDEKKTDYDRYLEVARSISNTRKESWDYVEKRMYTIASGALALSITLLSVTYDKGVGIHCKCLLVSSWGLLVATILVNFYSHYRTYNKAGDIINRIFGYMYKRYRYNHRLVNKIIDKYNSGTKCWNAISLTTLTLGVIGILSFYAIEIFCFA